MDRNTKFVERPIKTKMTIEKTYQKKSQLEHILLRPDTYIGSVERAQELMWIYDSEKEHMVQRTIDYVPGLYKIYDEILVNAADNKQKDPKMNCIKVDINVETNTISVWNNGNGIPVVMHKDEQMYVPTMIFGHLLTSSNYNDEEEKVTGGRNGYGAKLCNIFSTKFTVETASKEYKRQFKQTWGDNMDKASDAKVKDFTGEEFTKITFCPDLAKFKMDKLDEDIVGLMSRRAYDVAASTKGVAVYLNGKQLPVKSFKDYIDLYIKEREDDSGETLKVVHEVANDRWEIALTSSDKGFQQISFVNSIATTKGGRHVDYVTDMVVKQLIEVIRKKNKGGIAIKPFQVKNHMWIFVNCLIVNPTFDSQTKENMTLQSKNFGSKCTISEKFIMSVTKSGIVESVLSWAKFKAQNELQKQSGKKMTKLKGIPKLEDANEAGTKNAHKCTLILTEGDSAKTLAVSGLGVVGRDYYGVFPLRGKLLNVREASHKQILENAEINALIKIIGLQYKKKYTTEGDLRLLRYGKVMIMTDQDQDGSHIKGLIINFIHHNWPDLLQLNFLEEFITPIVKVKKRNEEQSFYSLPEFEEWRSNTPDHNKWTVKYYKGLGTSSSQEAKEYFRNMTRHRIRFTYNKQQDDNNITMAFSKKCVEKRKEWLLSYMADVKQRKEVGLPEKYLYKKNTQAITYSEFINLELVLYSNSDNVRSIPCMVDGLKPGQRKVLFTCIKRNDKKEVKVAQLAGSVAEHSAYHHGEQSLAMTIVNLAQNYVGSNNINLLEPRGQFGTRLCGGKDSASPRYIFTLMSPLTRLIFHPNDDALLTHEYDDNQKIEPVWYIPIIPMILVNGADGIGTGWMTKIPNFNPREIIENIRKMIDGEEPKPMSPWYKNFNGIIEFCGDQKYVVSGEVAIIGNDKIEITELPVGTWTQTYKENVLESMLYGSEKVKSQIADYKEYNTDTTVKFVVTCMPGLLEIMQREGLHKVFKLQTTISTSNMCVFDEMGCLRKFNNEGEILKEFYKLRITMYVKRKEYLQGSLEAETTRLSFQAKFILEKCKGVLTIENKKRKIMVDELVKRGYPADPVKEWKNRIAEKTGNKDNEEEAEPEEEDNQSQDEVDIKKESKSFEKLTDVKKYDYLLGMSMWMLTSEKKDELLRQKENKIAELNLLKSKKPSDLWRDDLDILMEKLDEVEEKERLEEAGLSKKAAKEKGGAGRKKNNHTETVPSPYAKRVVPIISEDLKKKLIAANKVKVNKEKKLAIQKEIVDLPDTSDEVDEFDVMLQKNKKTLQNKLKIPPEMINKKLKDDKEKKSSDGLKQTKLNFEKETIKGRGKTKKIASSDSETSFSSDSDSEELFLNNVPAVRQKPTRAVSKKMKYSFEESDVDSEKHKKEKKSPLISDLDEELVPTVKYEKITISPVSSRQNERKGKQSPPKREIFVNTESSPDEVKPSKKKVLFEKHTLISDSDSQEDMFANKMKATKKASVQKTTRSARVFKTIKYNFDDSDD